MQPLTLRAFLRQENKIINIFGYELAKMPDRIIISDGIYYRTSIPDDVKILRNSGFIDRSAQELFEDDLVTVDIDSIHPGNDLTFIGRVKFRNTRFVIEGTETLVEDCVSSQLKYIGNFNLNPLVFNTADK